VPLCSRLTFRPPRPSALHLPNPLPPPPPLPQLKKEKWQADCKAWSQKYAEARAEEAQRERQRKSQEHQEFMARREARQGRERFSTRRSARHDAAIHSVWDAAMHGTSRERAQVLLNVALADAAQTAAAEAGGEEVEVVPGGVRPPQELSAGVGTAPNSKALYHIDVANEVGEAPLHVAAWRGHVHVVQALLDSGADVNVVDTVYSMATPLHEAVRGGYRECVKALLDAGADVLAADASGDLPLHWCVDPFLCRLCCVVVGRLRAG